MKTFTLTLACVLMASLAHAADPAAHTVIVPYEAGTSLDGQKARRYYVPYEDFQKLWDAAKENRYPVRQDADATQMATILSALYRGKMQDTALVLEGRMQMVTRGEWTPVPLSVTSGSDAETKQAFIRDVRVDGRPAAAVGNQVRIEKAGPHVIEFNVTLPPLLAQSPMGLTFPETLAGALFLEAPRQDGPLLVNGRWVPAVESATEGRHFVIPLVDPHFLNETKRITLQRTTRGLGRGEDPSPGATVTTKLTLRELSPDHIETTIDFNFPGAARRSFAFSVDTDVILSSVRLYRTLLNSTGPVESQVQTQESDGRLVVKLTSEQEVSDSAKVIIQGLRIRSRDQSPLIQPVTARAQQQVTLLHEQGMDVKVLPAAGQNRLAAANAGAFHSAGSFKIGGAERLAFEVKPSADLDEAAVDYVFQLSEQKSELLAALSLKRKQGSWTRARIGLPPNYEVQSVQGPALQQWQHAGSELFLHFNPELAGKDARVIVHLARTVDQAVASWKVEPLRPVGFAKQSARGVIAAHAAMQVRLPAFAQRTDIQEIDPTSLDSTFAIAPPFEKKRGLRLEGLEWSIEVALDRQPARFSVDAIALVLVSDAGIRISQQVAATVEQGALRQVSVRLPAALPEAVVTGPLLREMRMRVKGAERVYDCSFQTDVLDRAELTFDHDLPLTASLAVPLVKVAEAQRLQRFFVLDNVSAREAKVSQSAALETVSREVVPYLPEGLSRPQFYRATSDASRLTISYTELNSTEANAALVTLADITTVLRADGERWDTATYSLINRSLQFLPIILPDGAELISVSVSGEAVRADQEIKEGRHVHLIPLIHTKPGQRALAVRLVWRFAPRDWLNATLDDPELVGLSAERTGWTVLTPPGYSLKDFDGNMEEVGAEGKDLQMLQGMLSELGEVNRELASGKLKYEEAEDAYSSANRLAEQISMAKREVFEKTRKFKTRLMSKESTAQVAAGERKVAELDKDVEKQQELLKDNWKGYHGKPEAKPGKASSKVDAKTDWNFNKEALQAKEPALRLSNTFNDTAVDQKGAQVVNDNVAVNNGFFENGNAIVQNQGSLMGGGLSGTGTLTLSGTNTYSGTTNLNSQAQGITNNGANALASNARANSLSNAAPPPPTINEPKAMIAPEEQMLKQLGDDINRRREAAVGNVSSLTIRQDGLSLRNQALGGAVAAPAPRTTAAAPALGSDPFAAPAPAPAAAPTLEALAENAPGAPLARAVPADQPISSSSRRDDGETRIVKNEAAAQLTAQTLESLRPTGRRSLALEVPLAGEARHFSKLKDHAILEVTIRRPWEPRQTHSAWVLSLGLIAFAGWSRLRRSPR